MKTNVKVNVSVMLLSRRHLGVLYRGEAQLSVDSFDGLRLSSSESDRGNRFVIPPHHDRQFVEPISICTFVNILVLSHKEM